MLSQIGGVLGLAYGLYIPVFRWKTLVGEYGTLSLYWWVVAVTTAASLLGFMADVAVWAVQYGLWASTS